MTVEFRLPDVGEGVAEGELVQWLVEPGDPVHEDQPVAEVETDKAVVEVPSPVDGTVGELRAEPGDVIPVGDVFVTFETDEGETASTGADESATEDAASAAGDEPTAESGADAEGGSEPEPSENGDDSTGGRVFAPPSVRRLARELEIDLSTVEGSGPSGRVTEMDVRVAAEPDEDDAASEPTSEAVETDAEAQTEASESAEAVATAVATERTGDGSAEEAAGPGAETADRDRTLAVPATRRLAADLGVDLESVPASDTREGQAVVSAAAVREYAESQQEAQAADAADLGAGSGAGEAAASGTTVSGDRVEREPYRGVRRTIGEAMTRAKFTAPHVTHHDRADATGLVEARRKLKPLAEERGVNLTYLPIVMKAVVGALKDHPVLNTALDEDNEEIVYKRFYNVGVAVATDAGLMVPVVDDVDRKSLVEIAAEVADLVGQARDRSIALEDMQGGTFTITNFGSVGGEYATPIVNYPETAILGLGALEQRPMVEGGSLEEPGEIVAKPVLPLSLSIDHRVIDGAEAAAFVNTLKEYLQDPTLLLLD